MSDRKEQLILGGEPRANLLPPEVEERNKARRRRGVLAGFVIAALVLVVVASAGAFFYASSAQAALAQSNSDTGTILAQAQKYQPVRSVAQQVTAVDQAAKTAASTEVQWAQLSTELEEALPAGAAIASQSYTLPTSGTTGSAATTDPDVVATASLTIDAKSLDTISKAVERLAKIPGYHSGSISGVTTSSSTSSDFVAAVTVTFNKDALSGRFSTPIALAGATQ